MPIILSVKRLDESLVIKFMQTVTLKPAKSCWILNAPDQVSIRTEECLTVKVSYQQRHLQNTQRDSAVHNED